MSFQYRCGFAVALFLACTTIAAQPAFADGGGDASDRATCSGGIPKDAVAACTRLIKAGPHDKSVAQLYLWRAYAERTLGEDKNEYQDLIAASQADPDMSKPWFGLAMASMSGKATPRDRAKANEYMARGYAAALKMESGNIQSNPNDAAAYTRRAGIYMDLGQYDLALADYQQAARLGDPHASGEVKHIEGWMSQYRSASGPPGRLGMGLKFVMGTNTNPTGAQVMGVASGSAAAQAGVEVNDIITQIDGVDVVSFDGMKFLTSNIHAGDKFHLDISRPQSGGYRDVQIVLSAAPAENAGSAQQ